MASKFKDAGQKIYTLFADEYLEQDSKLQWEDFVVQKDIGIVFDRYTKYIDWYTVTDKNKWLLAKIKYGI